MKACALRTGWRTDFFVHGDDVVIDERDDCLVVRTPAQPTFYWGNLLLLAQPPRDDALAFWLARFDVEIARRQPRSRHVAIGINAPPAGESLPSWSAAGFERFSTTALQLDDCAALRCASPARGKVSFRPLDLSREVPLAVDLQCCDDDGYEPVGYRTHRTAQMKRYAALARDGRAAWFGVWCDGTLAAGCGLVRQTGGSECRFQHVMTHPSFRRRGLCGQLVEQACRWAFDTWQAQRLVMCADPDDVAIGIYRSAGFTAVDAHWGLQRRAPQDAPSATAGKRTA